MGLPPDKAGEHDVPPRRVRISRGFSMDQYEVTIEQFVRFANAVGNRCPEPGPGDGRCLNAYGGDAEQDSEGRLIPRPRYERLPIRVSKPIAMAYCAWAGKVLPTEAQWALAAFHDPATGRDRLYPWGDEPRTVVPPCEGPACERDFSLEVPVGTTPEDRSATGLVDMGGNATEWVSDCFAADPPCVEPCTDPELTVGCTPSRCADGGMCLTARGGPGWTGLHRYNMFESNENAIRCVVNQDSPAPGR